MSRTGLGDYTRDVFKWPAMLFPLRLGRPRSPLSQAVHLLGWRLTHSGAFRAAWVGSAVVSLVFCLSTLYLHAQGPFAGQLGQVPGRAAVIIGWLAGAVVGLRCSRNRAALDQAEGISEMARCHGVDEPTLERARLLTPTLALAKLVFWTVSPVLLVAAALSGSLAQGAVRLLAFVPLLAYALGVGLVAGALSAGCAWLAPRRGRWLFAAVVLLPWLFEDLLIPGSGRIGSLPQLLGTMADWISAVGGVR